MVETIILGAGPAGMMAGYELSKNNGNCIIFEKNEFVGGLARTLKFDKFLTDIGPHRFYSKKKYLYEVIGEILGKNWISVNRLSRFYVNGVLFKYPVELTNALFGVGPYKAFRMMTDYSYEKIKNFIAPKKIVSFQDYAISNFGKTLAKFSMLDYTEKIWGIPTNKMSADWAIQRIGGLSLFSTLKNMVFKDKNKPTSLVDKFYYPKYGTGLLYKEMEKIIKKEKNNVLLKSEIVGVNHKNNKITSVSVKRNGRVKEYKCSHCISSVPITLLSWMLNPKPPNKIIDAIKNLRHRSQIFVFIELNKPRVTKDNWIYFPDKNIPFGRFHEPRNFSKAMSPNGKTSLMIEYFVFDNEGLWNKDKNEIFELTIKYLVKLGFIKREEVIKCYLHREKFVYPLYTLDYKKNIDTVKEHLRKFSNLFFIGRGGRFKYHAQDIALDTGFVAARSIIENKWYDIDNIGEEQEYAEKGSLQE